MAVLTASALYVGGWAASFPKAFYDNFPGLGRTWVSIDGPYNEHLVRDVGAFYLALALVGVLALMWRERHVTFVVAAAWAMFSAPHLAYHLVHVDELDTIDALGQTASLAVTLLLALYLLFATGRNRSAMSLPADPGP